MKKGEAVILFVIILGLFNLSLVSAVSNVNLKITGTIGSYSSDVWLKTSSFSNTGFDVYDMDAPSSPSNYSQFYSSITGHSLGIDSWNPIARTLNLVYSMSPAQSGILTFSWDAVSGSNYEATFKNYGNDSGYSTLVGSQNMRSGSSYTTPALTSESSIYIQVVVTDYSADEVDDGDGGGGGAASTTVSQPDIDIILDVNPDKLLFDANIIVTDEFKSIFEGDKMKSTINLIPMGQDPYLDVELRYSVRNFEGREFAIGESETILVTGQKGFDKEFSTQSLPPGDYILSLELKYETEPDKFAIATSTSQFKVEAKKEAGKGLLSLGAGYKYIILILGGAILVLIVLIILLFGRHKKIRKR